MILLTLALRRSWMLVAVAAITASIAGALHTALLALLVSSLEAPPTATPVPTRFIVLLLTLPLASFWGRHLMARLSQQSAARLRERLCEQILRTPLDQLERIGRSRLAAALGEDVATIAATLSSLPTLLTSGVIVLGGLAYLLWLSRPIAGLVVASLAVQIVAFALIHERGLKRMRRARVQRDRLFHCYRSVVEGIKELQLHRRRREAFGEEVLRPASSQVARENNAGHLWFVAGQSGVQAFMLGVFGLLVFTRGLGDPEALAAALVLVISMSGHVDVLFSGPAAFARGRVALANLNALGLPLELEEEQPAHDQPRISFDGWRRIELQAVRYDYRAEDAQRLFTCGPLTLTVDRQEILFVIGGNGSGKTTLAKILTGLYAPSAGAIVVDGRPIGDGQREGYRQLFSTVFSDFFLFDRLLGVDGVGADARACAILRDLALHEVVDVRAGRLSTIDLSQGQRKRLALLVALLEERSVYVFDEWAADQDPEFRALFYGRFLPALRARGATAVVITHDDRYFHVADRVVKLEYGSIVEEAPAARFEAPVAVG